jgi:hypothetical protein
MSDVYVNSIFYIIAHFTHISPGDLCGGPRVRCVGLLRVASFSDMYTVASFSDVYMVASFSDMYTVASFSDMYVSSI